MLVFSSQASAQSQRFGWCNQCVSLLRERVEASLGSPKPCLPSHMTEALLASIGSSPCASEAERVEFLSLAKFLLESRGGMLDRAAEIVDKGSVVLISSPPPCPRTAFLVSGQRQSYMCVLLPVPTCMCHDFVFTVAKGTQELVYVSAHSLSSLPIQVTC